MKKNSLGLTLLFLIGCIASSSFLSSCSTPDTDPDTPSENEPENDEFTPTDRPLNEDVVDVYFIAGQSNAAGCSDFYRNNNKTLNLSDKYASKAQKYIDGFNNIYYYGYSYGTSKTGTIVSDDIITVKPGLGVTAGREIGAELGMAEYLSDRYANTNKKALIIKYAACSSGILSDTSCTFAEWSAPSYPNPAIGTQENLFTNMVGTQTQNYADGVIYKALEKAIAKGFTKFDFKGFYWSQGEGDLGKTDYGAAFTALMGDFRTNIDNVSKSLKAANQELTFSDATTLPFLISEINATFSTAYKKVDNTSSNADINAIVGYQRDVASKDANTETLTTYMYNIIEHALGYKSPAQDGYSYCGDKWHYNADDMIDIGNRVASILHTFTVGQGKCDHAFDNYTSEEATHTKYCSKCLDYVTEEHTFSKAHNDKKHYDVCECGYKTNEEDHIPTVKASKLFEVGEVLDKTLFTKTNTCTCGYEGSFKSFDFTLSEETASTNTKIIYTYNGNEYKLGLPLAEVQIEGENHNISGNTSNYQLEAAQVEIEAGVGQNKTDSVGTKSIFAKPKTDTSSALLWTNSTFTIKVNSDAARTLSLSMLAASTYNKKAAFDLENACDLYLNGKHINFAEDSSFKGGTVDWFSWENVHIQDLALSVGENIIQLVMSYEAIMKQSNGQGPFNLDYFTLRYL